MDKTVIKTSNAPDAIGPYSQAVRSGSTLYLSGQIPLDPASMQIVEGGISDQTRQVFKNLEAVLKEGGATFDNVVKTTVYLADMGQFAEMNKVYAEFLSLSARATVEVSRLPKDVLVEIDLIATL